MSDKPKILVIDDDSDAQQRLSVILRRAGYDVAAAVDAVMCLSVARRLQPDLILLDLGLPGGSGFDVLQRVRNNTDLLHLPVLVFTASETEEARARALECGAVGFLGKSATRDELLGAIERSLAG